LSLESLDEDLEYCFCRICFVFPLHFYVVVLVLICCFISQVLALSEKQCEKWVAESAQVAKIAELEVVARSQADRRVKKIK
jgi:ABC-type protease/lipase transport system fused ATPase/permease subunit